MHHVWGFHSLRAQTTLLVCPRDLKSEEVKQRRQSIKGSSLKHKTITQLSSLLHNLLQSLSYACTSTWLSRIGSPLSTFALWFMAALFHAWPSSVTRIPALKWFVFLSLHQNIGISSHSLISWYKEFLANCADNWRQTTLNFITVTAKFCVDFVVFGICIYSLHLTWNPIVLYSFFPKSVSSCKLVWVKIKFHYWRKRRLISKMYVDQTVKLKLDQGEKIRAVRHGRSLSLILFNFYSECLNKEPLEGVEDFKIGRKIIHTVKYVDDLVLLTKEETVLQGMTDVMEWKQMWIN